MLPAPLYFDTARLGRMSPTARRLSTAFIRLSAEEPFNLYGEKFLRDGFRAWPATYQGRFSELRQWRGTAALRRGLRKLAGAANHSDVILASRSLVLIEAAARAAFRCCRKMLTIDLAWPTYLASVKSVGKSVAGEVVALRLRNRVLREGMTADEFVEAVAAGYSLHGCDSLFLPAVDNLGVRVPVEAIVRAIEHRTKIRFVLIDGAQALGHVALAGIVRCSDVVVAGCHKWVGGYYPLGVGLIGDRAGNASSAIQAFVRRNDPLAGFLASLESGQFARHAETVNLGPLFSCQGALDDLADLDLQVSIELQRAMAEEVRRLAVAAGCRPVTLDRSLQTGIQLVLTESGSAKPARANDIERRLMRAGIVATAYDDGMVRVSLPRQRLSREEARRLHRALKAATRRCRKVPTTSETTAFEGDLSNVAEIQ